MSSGFDGASKRRRAVIALLVLAAMVALGASFWSNHQTQAKRASLARPAITNLPAASTTGEPAASAPASTATTVAPAPVVRPVVPSNIQVDPAGVNASVYGAPTDPKAWDAHTKSYEPSFPKPIDMYHVVWWSSGPAPGSNGMAILLGHHQIGGYGVFNNIENLQPGQQIKLQGQGEILYYAVTTVKNGIPKDDPTALDAALYAAPAGSRLALVTCSGDIDNSLSSHDDNTVVFAKLIGVTNG